MSCGTGVTVEAGMSFLERESDPLKIVNGLASIPGMWIRSRSPSNMLEVESKSSGHLIHTEAPSEVNIYHNIGNRVCHQWLHTYICPEWFQSHV